ncbi:hypothetical protein [Flavihumibacter sp. CACIAM 22H1]|uniref:hypothetical protein n=1 Tax=Flavihumibacter sp. CACIAM 22H1 TaxID=1812911 RepID=UPI0007A80B90|nr:hypothetical protein [Flavihumibacter sp. CACIAM 22H1]KYP14870.1 MAG: hypothetical protein A1D16_07720 [Flavihumibacter sp. CACIAM 22H1]
MNATFPYEQLIASKLEELPPLPEMADMIWLRISTELDTDQPSDDDDFGGGGPDEGGEPVTGPAVGGPMAGISGWSLLVLLGGIALFLLYRLSLNTGTPTQEIQELPSAINPDTSAVNEPTLSADKALQTKKDGLRSAEGTATAVQDTVAQPASQLFVPGFFDSSSLLQSSIPLTTATGRPDSTRLDTVSSTTRPELQKDSTGGRKRPSGIKGINSDDYRILPQKDQKDST